MELQVTDYISSRQNSKIKNIITLEKPSERRKQGLFSVEGIKEIEKLLTAGYEIDSLFFCSKLITNEKIIAIFRQKIPERVYDVSLEVFEKIAVRENAGGIVVLAKLRQHDINSIKLKENPLFLVLESVEKPGNMGALYRTADAAGIDAVIICDPKTDLYNANTIRASLGCVFTVPTAICSSMEAIEFLKYGGVKIFATYLQASIPYHTADFKQSSAVVMGTEADGISKIWVDAADKNIIIPMRGTADSLNVSVSAAIVLFEACRQREFR